MVELLRIDERLLHGQVATTWVNAVSPDAILIANDEAATNEMSKLALKMAKPAGCKLAIKTISDAAELLNNPKADKIKIFVITRTIVDTLQLLQLTDSVKKINLGGVKKREGGKMVAASIFLNKEDIENLNKIEELVEEIEVRMVPSEPRTPLAKVLK